MRGSLNGERTTAHPQITQISQIIAVRFNRNHSHVPSDRFGRIRVHFQKRAVAVVAVHSVSLVKSVDALFFLKAGQR
jgi:hypothetical protein